MLFSSLWWFETTNLNIGCHGFYRLINGTIRGLFFVCICLAFSLSVCGQLDAMDGQGLCRLGMASNTTFPWSKHPFIYTLQSIWCFCCSEKPDARGSSLAVIVLISAVGQIMHCRILGRKLACECSLSIASLVLTAGVNGYYSHQQVQLRNSIGES